MFRRDLPGVSYTPRCESEEYYEQFSTEMEKDRQNSNVVELTPLWSKFQDCITKKMVRGRATQVIDMRALIRTFRQSRGAECIMGLVINSENLEKYEFTNVDYTGNEANITQLMVAAHRGDGNLVKRLVECGADVNVQQKNGNTALMEAAYFGHEDCARFLITSGAIVDLNNKAGQTALVVSCINDLSAITRLLGMKGADVNVKTKAGQTPLIISASRGDLETSRILVNELGADILEEDNYNLTAACRGMITSSVVGFYLNTELVLRQQMTHHLQRRMSLAMKSPGNQLLHWSIFYCMPCWCMIEQSRLIMLEERYLDILYGFTKMKAGWDERWFVSFKVHPWFFMLLANFMYGLEDAVPMFLKGCSSEDVQRSLSRFFSKHDAYANLVVSMVVFLSATEVGRKWLDDQRGNELGSLWAKFRPPNQASSENSLIRLAQEVTKFLKEVAEDIGYNGTAKIFGQEAMEQVIPKKPCKIEARITKVLRAVRVLAERAQIRMADRNMELLILEVEMDKQKLEKKKEKKKLKQKQKRDIINDEKAIIPKIDAQDTTEAVESEGSDHDQIVGRLSPRHILEIELGGAFIEHMNKKQRRKINKAKKQNNPFVTELPARSMTATDDSEACHTGDNVSNNLSSGEEKSHVEKVVNELVTEGGDQRPGSRNEDASRKVTKELNIKMESEKGKGEKEHKQDNTSTKLPERSTKDNYYIKGKCVTMKAVVDDNQGKKKNVPRTKATMDRRNMIISSAAHVQKEEPKIKQAEPKFIPGHWLDKFNPSKSENTSEETACTAQANSDQVTVTKSPTLSVENGQSQIPATSLKTEMKVETTSEKLNSESDVQRLSVERDIVNILNYNNAQHQLPRLANKSRCMKPNSHFQNINARTNRIQNLFAASNHGEQNFMPGFHDYNPLPAIVEPHMHFPSIHFPPALPVTNAITANQLENFLMSNAPRMPMQSHAPPNHQAGKLSFLQDPLPDVGNLQNAVYASDTPRVVYPQYSVASASEGHEQKSCNINNGHVKSFDTRMQAAGDFSHTSHGGAPINWLSRSLRWRSKLQKLVNMERSERQQVGAIYFCCNRPDMIIGSGAQGTIVTVGLRYDGMEVAVKRMLRIHYPSIKNELEKLRMPELEHPNIVKYRDYAEDMNFSYLALELCEYTLDDYLLRLKQTGDLAARGRALSQQLLVGLDTLHRAGVLHMDLKPQNILIDIRGNLRLSDFGVSKQLAETEQTILQHAVTGTKCWRPREVLEPSCDGQRYKAVSDIQVAGMLIYYIITGGSHPYGDEPSVCEMNIRHGRPRLHELGDNVVLIHLLGWMLHPCMENRHSADQCLRHPYFWEEDRRFLLLQRIGNEPEIRNSTVNETCMILDSAYHWIGYQDWLSEVDQTLRAELAQHREYKPTVTDLLKFMRNTEEFFSEMSPSVQELIGEPSVYFKMKFPRVFMPTYEIIRKSDWARRRMLKEFFE